jgi:hypothetical protein
MNNTNIPDPSDVAYRTQVAAIEEFQGPIDGITATCGTWIKVRAKYADRWSTPMAGAEFNLWVGDELIADKKHLKDYEHIPGLTVGEPPPEEEAAQKEWYEKYNQLGTLVISKCQHGKARFELTKGSSADEKKIEALNKAIEARLDGEYRNLLKQMTPFQQEWDKQGVWSIRTSYKSGQHEGGKDWLKDQEELFTWKYWEEIGTAITKNTPILFDTAKEMGLELVDKRIDQAEELWSNRHNAVDPMWWMTQGEAYIDNTTQEIKEAKEYIEEFVTDAYQSSMTANEIFKRKDAIFALPSLIGAGRVDEIEAFIDIDLHAIDPEWAAQLKFDKSWQEMIELLNDGEAVANFVVYLDLCTKASPPNFYSFHFGKGAFYIQVELILLLLGVLLGGAGAAARIAVITARLANMTTKGNKVVKQSQNALLAYQRTYNGFTKVIEDFTELRGLLLKNRRAQGKNGSSGTELEQQRETKKRDSSCRICKSKKHNTPLHRGGNTDYRD